MPACNSDPTAVVGAPHLHWRASGPCRHGHRGLRGRPGLGPWQGLPLNPRSLFCRQHKAPGVCFVAWKGRMYRAGRCTGPCPAAHPRAATPAPSQEQQPEYSANEVCRQPHRCRFCLAPLAGSEPAGGSAGTAATASLRKSSSSCPSMCALLQYSTVHRSGSRLVGHLAIVSRVHAVAGCCAQLADRAAAVPADGQSSLLCHGHARSHRAAVWSGPLFDSVHRPGLPVVCPAPMNRPPCLHV